MRLKKPKSIEEAQERIRVARLYLRASPRMIGLQEFDLRVAYRVPENVAWSKDLIRRQQKTLDQERKSLSRVERRRFRRHGQISLVCDLLRRSPVFLREKWINDLILERKKTVSWSEKRARREEALEDLKAISKAILCESFPLGERSSREEWKRLSAKLPRRTTPTDMELTSRYSNYLEIGTCLLEGKHLTRKQWAPAGRPLTRSEELPKYAKMFGVPESWIKSAWEMRNARARDWALRRLATHDGSTVQSVRGRLGRAQKALKDERETDIREFEARQRAVERRKR